MAVALGERRGVRRGAGVACRLDVLYLLSPRAFVGQAVEIRVGSLTFPAAELVMLESEGSGAVARAIRRALLPF